MLQIKRFEMVLLCVLVVFEGASIVASQGAVAANQAPTEVLSVGVAKPLKAAQEQIRQKDKPKLPQRVKVRFWSDRMYLSYGQYDQAVEALKAGISKGGVGDVDEAQMSLGSLSETG